MTGMAWKERSRFLSFRNSLEWRNSFTACLQWLKQAEVGFGLPEIAWNVRSRFWLEWLGIKGRRFWHDWNGLERKK
jgi:hypothetical protein